jgi:hypothetical protein
MDHTLASLIVSLANIIGAVIVAWVTKGATRRARKRTPPPPDRDIEVLGMPVRTVKMADGKMGRAYEITYRLRGQDEYILYIPEEQYSKAYADQMLMRHAAEIVDFRDRFPVKG